MLLVVVLYALLALTFPLSQFALYYSKPVFLIAFRMLLAGVLLLGYYRIVRGKISVDKKDWWLFLKTAFLYIYLAFIPEFWALQYVSSLKTTIMFSLTPFITAFFEYFLFHYRFSKEKIAGMIVGTLGFVPLLLLPNTQCLPFGTCRVQFLPEIMLMIAITSGAYAWFLVKELNKKGYSLILINGITMLLGGFMSLITHLVTSPLAELPISDFPRFLVYTLALIGISNVIVYNLYGTLLKKYSATFLSFAGFLSPIFGTVYAWLFFKEHISWHYFVSFIFVSLGLWMFYHGEKKN